MYYGKSLLINEALDLNTLRESKLMSLAENVPTLKPKGGACCHLLIPIGTDDETLKPKAAPGMKESCQLGTQSHKC